MGEDEGVPMEEGNPTPGEAVTLAAIPAGATHPPGAEDGVTREVDNPTPAGAIPAVAKFILVAVIPAVGRPIRAVDEAITGRIEATAEDRAIREAAGATTGVTAIAAAIITPEDAGTTEEAVFTAEDSTQDVFTRDVATITADASGLVLTSALESAFHSAMDIIPRRVAATMTGMDIGFRRPVMSMTTTGTD
jgi:hypothetical protein